MSHEPTATAAEIDLPNRPDVPGLRFRRFRGGTDIAGMATANQEARVAAGALETVTPESMAVRYANFVHCDPERDILIVELDGRIVGYARAEWRDLVDGNREFESFCLLVPSIRGRGIGRAMLGFTEARLADHAARVPDDRPGHLGTWTWASDGHATSLLRSEGWTLRRLAHDLLRPDLAAIPDLPLPDGLEVRELRTEGARALWDAMVEAFRDHPGEPEPEEADWTEFRDDPRQDPSLWVIAFDGDQIAGGVVNVIEPLPDGAGPSSRAVLDTVFTRGPWRRRGLARALIARSLVVLRARGLHEAYLGVDTENPNQAMTLYESLGFRVACTENYWTKPMPAGPAAEGDRR
jgi:GNAT superfamily N-acetyltransferase